MISNDLMKLQQDLMHENKLMEVNAKLILPKIGGYNARPYDSMAGFYEPPRPSEIKALWRWWMRAILSGVFGGKEDYKELEKKVSEILGSTESISCFSMNVIPDEKNIKELEQKAWMVKKLLTEIIPRILLKFKTTFSKCNVATVFLSFSIPITITFRLKKPKQYFEHKLREFISVSPRYRKNKNEARVILKSSSELKHLVRRLGLGVEERILRIYDELVKLSEIPRIKLILQPRREEGEDNRLVDELSDGNKRYLERISEELALPETIPIKIEIYTNYVGCIGVRRICCDKRFVRFALQTLLLALILGGIGSSARRGLGSIIIKSVKIRHRSFKDLEDRVEEIIKANNAEDLENRLLEFVRSVWEVCKKLYYKGWKAEEENHLPKVPSIISDKYFKLKVIGCPKEDIHDIVKIMGLSSLKVEWKRITGMGERAPGGSLHTWILGLPRRARQTGYFINSEPGRRISAINLKIFRNASSKTFIIVYGFLSKDWSVDKLIHKSSLYPVGRKVKTLSIRGIKMEEKAPKSDEKILKLVFNAAYEFVLNVLSKHCKESNKYCG